MKRVIIAPAELGGAALNELKQWLAISTEHDDDSLIAVLESSLEMCEAYTGTMPLSATCEEILPAMREWQCLATRPVQAITAAEGIPAEGPRFTLAADAFEIELEADGSGLLRTVRQGSAGRIAVRFVAGHSRGWGSLPDGLRQGIIRSAAHQFGERNSGGSTSPPAAVKALWRPWRRVKLA